MRRPLLVWVAWVLPMLPHARAEYVKLVTAAGNDALPDMQNGGNYGSSATAPHYCFNSDGCDTDLQRCLDLCTAARGVDGGNCHAVRHWDGQQCHFVTNDYILDPASLASTGWSMWYWEEPLVSRWDALRLPSPSTDYDWPYVDGGASYGTPSASLETCFYFNAGADCSEAACQAACLAASDCHAIRILVTPGNQVCYYHQADYDLTPTLGFPEPSGWRFYRWVEAPPAPPIAPPSPPPPPSAPYFGDCLTPAVQPDTTEYYSPDGGPVYELTAEHSFDVDGCADPDDLVRQALIAGGATNGGAFSIQVDVKCTYLNTGGEKTIIAWGRADGVNSIDLRYDLDGEAFRAEIGDDVANNAYAKANLCDDVWHTVVYEMNGLQRKVFVDGVRAGQTMVYGRGIPAWEMGDYCYGSTAWGDPGDQNQNAWPGQLRNLRIWMNAYGQLTQHRLTTVGHVAAAARWLINHVDRTWAIENDKYYQFDIVNRLTFGVGTEPTRRKLVFQPWHNWTFAIRSPGADKFAPGRRLQSCVIEHGAANYGAIPPDWYPQAEADYSGGWSIKLSGCAHGTEIEVTDSTSGNRGVIFYVVSSCPNPATSPPPPASCPYDAYSSLTGNRYWYSTWTDMFNSRFVLWHDHGSGINNMYYSPLDYATTTREEAHLDCCQQCLAINQAEGWTTHPSSINPTEHHCYNFVLEDTGTSWACSFWQWSGADPPVARHTNFYSPTYLYSIVAMEIEAYPPPGLPPSPPPAVPANVWALEVAADGSHVAPAVLGTAAALASCNTDCTAATCQQRCEAARYDPAGPCVTFTMYTAADGSSQCNFYQGDHSGALSAQVTDPDAGVPISFYRWIDAPPSAPPSFPPAAECVVTESDAASLAVTWITLYNNFDPCDNGVNMVCQDNTGEAYAYAGYDGINGVCEDGRILNDGSSPQDQTFTGHDCTDCGGRCCGRQDGGCGIYDGSPTDTTCACYGQQNGGGVATTTGFSVLKPGDDAATQTYADYELSVQNNQEYNVYFKGANANWIGLLGPNGEGACSKTWITGYNHFDNDLAGWVAVAYSTDDSGTIACSASCYGAGAGYFHMRMTDGMCFCKTALRSDPSVDSIMRVGTACPRSVTNARSFTIPAGMHVCATNDEARAQRYSKAECESYAATIGFTLVTEAYGIHSAFVASDGGVCRVFNTRDWLNEGGVDYNGYDTGSMEVWHIDARNADPEGLYGPGHVHWCMDTPSATCDVQIGDYAFPSYTFGEVAFNNGYTSNTHYGMRVRNCPINTRLVLMNGNGNPIVPGSQDRGVVARVVDTCPPSPPPPRAPPLAPQPQGPPPPLTPPFLPPPLPPPPSPPPPSPPEPPSSPPGGPAPNTPPVPPVSPPPLPSTPPPKSPPLPPPTAPETVCAHGVTMLCQNGADNLGVSSEEYDLGIANRQVAANGACEDGQGSGRPDAASFPTNTQMFRYGDDCVDCGGRCLGGVSEADCPCYGRQSSIGGLLLGMGSVVGVGVAVLVSATIYGGAKVVVAGGSVAAAKVAAAQPAVALAAKLGVRMEYASAAFIPQQQQQQQNPSRGAGGGLNFRL